MFQSESAASVVTTRDLGIVEPMKPEGSSGDGAPKVPTTTPPYRLSVFLHNLEGCLQDAGQTEIDCMGTDRRPTRAATLCSKLWETPSFSTLSWPSAPQLVSVRVHLLSSFLNHPNGITA